MKQRQLVTVVPPLQINLFFNSDKPEIQAIIEKAGHSVDLAEQQKCIKLFAAYLGESADTEDKELALKILTFVFTFTTPKVLIKKTVGRILTNFKDHDLLTKTIFETIEMFLNRIDQEKSPDNEAVLRDAFVGGLGTSMDLKPTVTAILDHLDVVFKPALAFLLEVVDVLWERRLGSSPIMTHKIQYVYNGSKLLLSILQRSKAKAINEEDRLRLITCCYDIMTHPHITYDTKSNCAYIIVILFTALPKSILDECTFQENPYFEFLKFGKEQSPALEKLGIQNIEDTAVFEIFKVCIYSSVMIISPAAALLSCTLEQDVFSIAFTELLEFAKRAKGNPVQVMGITKALSYMSCHFLDLPFEKADLILKDGLNYVVTYLDDRSEIVRNNIKAIFKNFIKLAVKYQDEGNPKLWQMILKWLKNLRDGVFYKALVVFGAEVGFAVLLDNIPNLADLLLCQLVHPSKAHSICSCYETLMESHLKEGGCEDDWVKYWVNAIVVKLKLSKPPLTPFFQRLFVSAFKMRPVALKAITQTRYLDSDSELGALLSCIHHARKTGLNLSVDNLYAEQIDKSRFWNNLIEFKTMTSLATYQNNEIRILVLAILVESHKSTETFTEWELDAVRKCLYYNINPPCASTRQELVSYAKKAMVRIDQSSKVMRRSIEEFKSTPKPNAPASAAQAKAEFACTLYEQFWHSYFCDVLLPGLNPDCNYSRKSACLELLNFACTTFYSIEKFFAYWTRRDFSNLKHILQYDTYEQNKDTAGQLLIKCDSKLLGFHQQESVAKYVDECFLLALSIKPSETVAAAYMLKMCLGSPHMGNAILQKLCKTVSMETLQKMTVSEQFFEDTTCMLLFQLIFELKECSKVGEHSLQEAAAAKPLHGFLFCIRHILKNENLSDRVSMPHWKIFVKDILYWCYRLSEVICPIICNQSPEGFLPDSDMDVPVSDITAMAQMVTVYGWRAAKEISLLLGELALTAPFCDENTEGLINENQLRSIGNYLFYLLINTKHRGAFEQASVGFSNLCSRMWRLPTSSSMPAEWLDKILNVVLGITEENMDTCATRRSAGVPFMVQAILTTEPNTNGNKHFHSCMNILLTVAGDPTRPEDQRTHCMNIMRALYRNNQLGELVIPYCSRGVIISVEGFGNSSWSIRNSATLLFSALMVRIFGVQRVRATEIVSIKNKMIAQVFFTRYPELYPFLVQKLEEGTVDVHHPSLFPVLLILSRLYHCPGSTDTFQLQAFLPYMEYCFANPVYRIRDMAAKIFVNLTSPDEVPRLIVRSFVCLTNATISNNHCHGLLLQVQYLLQSREDGLPRLNLEKIFDNTAWILLCCGKQLSHVTCALYLEILLYLIRRFDPHFNNCDLFKKIASVINWLTVKSQHSKVVSTAEKKYRVNMFNLKLCVIMNMYKFHVCEDYATKLKMCETYIYGDVQKHLHLQNLCLSYANYIKFKGPGYEHHDLYEDDDSEQCEPINKFLNPLQSEYKVFVYQVMRLIVQSLLGTRKVEDTSSLEMLVIHDLPEYLKHYDTYQVTQWLLEYSVDCCNSSNEQIVRICIAWLDNFLSGLQGDIQQLNVNNLFDLLIKFCAPAAETSYRLGVAKLLVHNKRLFYEVECILNWSNVCMLWEAVFILLEDDDEEVRNTICQLCEVDLSTAEYQYTLAPKMRTFTPEYARERLLYNMANVLPIHCCMNILLSLILRTGEIADDNLSEVFEEGTTNAFAELYPTARLATDLLHSILWEMDDGLNFKDKSIFVEEQTLLVATTLYDKFYRNVVPLLSAAMSTAVRNILARMILYLEKETINQEHFKCHLKSIINLALDAKEIKLLDVSEIIRLKMFLSIIFKLALWH